MSFFQEIFKSIHFRRISVGLLTGLVLLALVRPEVARASDSEKIAVVVSMTIRPYMDAAEGIRQIVTENTQAGLDLFMLENYQAERRGVLADRLSSGGFQTCIAVGPEAARFVWNEVHGRNIATRLYTMVLNPENVIPEQDILCGIPLNIPAEKQIGDIAESLPNLEAVGLLFDPANNQQFFRDASLSAGNTDLHVMPIRVGSRKEIPAVLRGVWTRIGALWLIPDQTVISEGLVRYIIKEAIANGVTVVGYNRFFYDSGAGMAMVLDYHQIGRQVGQFWLDRMAGQVCRRKIPDYQILLNHAVLEKIGLPYRRPPETKE